MELIDYVLHSKLIDMTVSTTMKAKTDLTVLEAKARRNIYLN